MSIEILRRPQVERLTGLARSTLYDRVKQGLFPKPIKLGAKAIAWPESDVAAINSARIAGKSDVEIRELVVALEFARRER